MSPTDRARQTAGFSTEQLAKLSGVSPTTLARWIRRGLVACSRDSDGAPSFDFRDVARVRQLASLLTGLRGRKAAAVFAAAAEGVALRQQEGEVVAWDEAGAWEPQSGQGVLSFEGAAVPTAAKVVSLAGRHRDAEVRGSPLESLFERALEAEAADPELAISLYLQVIEGDEDRRAEACVNLGRLHQVAGNLAGAIARYEQALRSDPLCASAWFNLGVARHDSGDARGALSAYAEAVAVDPTMVDAHFNAATVCEALGDRQRALRHWHRYRELTEA